MRCIQFLTLQTFTVFCFLSKNVKDGIYELRSFRVVAFRPVVASTALSENEVIRLEDLAKFTRSNRIHDARLKVKQDCTRYKTATARFVEIDIGSFQLARSMSNVGSHLIHAMLIADNFPELRPNLVAALTGLDMDDLPHP